MTDRPAEGTHLFLLDESGILFSEPRQEMYVLNTSAAVIWCHLEDGKDAGEIVSELVEAFGLSADQASRFVDAALADWRTKGFLAGDDTPVPTPVPEPSRPNLPPWQDGPWVVEKSYRLLSSNIRLRFTDAIQEAVVHPILAHLEGAGDGPETCIDLVAFPTGIAVYREKEPMAGCRGINEVGPIVKGLIWTTAVRDHDFFLDIHAGVVNTDSGCILLPAPPGRGKSTLTAALVHAGFTFFSDEVALLEAGTFHVHPVPLALCVKDKGIEPLIGYFPQLRDLPLHNRGDGKRVCYMPPPDGALPGTRDPQPVKAIVFPCYQEGTETTLEPMGTVGALKLLMEECLVVDRRLDKRNVADLIDWVGGLPCYRLRYSVTEKAVSLIATL